MIAKKFCLFLWILAAAGLSAGAQTLPKKGSPPQRIYGLTIENLDELDVDDFGKKFSDVAVPITLRVVFQAGTTPDQYEEKLRRLRNPKAGRKRFNILALPFDSYALRSYRLAADPAEDFDCRRFTAADQIYDHRAKCFVEYFSGTKDYVDAWEVGNEVNGEWADEDYKPGLPPETTGKPERTIEKIGRLINLIPADKPIMLTVSYMPDCLDWTANAMDRWIENFPRHMPPKTFDRIDYVLVSYYENNCNFHVLGAGEIDNDIFKPLRKVFPGRFVGVGEIGYSDGEDEGFETCRRDKSCYCKKGDAGVRKSKISQMQRYYGMRPADPLYVGGGFWWNAGTDYKVSRFRDALKSQFTCLATNRRCDPHLPVDCG
jgi:hypothetical protein